MRSEKGQPATGECSKTLAAVAAWGTVVDRARAAVGVRETMEEAVERRWMNLALTSCARRMWEREGAASQQAAVGEGRREREERAGETEMRGRRGRATEEEDGGRRRRASRRRGRSRPPWPPARVGEGERERTNTRERRGREAS